MPMGFGLWKLEHPGHASGVFAMRNPGVQLRNYPDPRMRARIANIDFSAASRRRGSRARRKWCSCSSDRLPVPLIQRGMRPSTLPPFFIDRFEVTNREFKEFIDAGGYARAELWRDLPFGDAVAGLAWRQSRQFVDATGRPGPATWEAGTYPDGTGDHPVAGVSWFEAVAYARFRGKELPTAYHWYRAAMSLNERLESLGAAIIGASNFAGKGTAPVGRHAGIGPYGTYDMAGNVREWLWNAVADGRSIAGGAWNQAPYIFLELDVAPPWDRSAGNGIRCMRTQHGLAYATELRGAHRAEVDRLRGTRTGRGRRLRGARAAARILTGGPGSARRAAPVDESALAARADHDRHRLRRLALRRAAVPADRGHAALPASGLRTPCRVHEAALRSNDFEPTESAQPLDFILKSGRALVVVALDGSFERHWPPEHRQSMSAADRYRTRLRHARQDLGRAIDYLATRDDIDIGRLGWFGVS